MEAVYLKSVELIDVGIFPKLKFEAGAITILSGANAQGKSTILNAIQDVFEGGHDPSLIRNFGKPMAAEKAEIILNISDGATIRKWITAEGYEVKARTGEGVPIKRVKEYLETLAKSFSLDPLALLDCSAKDRIKFVQDAMPIIFTAAEVNAALGVATQVKALDLAGIQGLRDAKYEDRKGKNGATKQLDGAIAESRQALGPDDDRDWLVEFAAIEAEINSLRTDLATAKTEIESQVQRNCNSANAVAELSIAAIKEEAANTLKKFEVEAAQVYAEGCAETNTRIAELRQKMGEISARADQQKRNSGLRAGIERMNEERRKAGFEADRLTTQIAAIDKLKLEKLRMLPVPGVEVKNGDIAVDGVTWEQVNTGEKMKVSIAFAALMLGKLPLMITDRMESLDANGFAILREVAKDMKLQILAAKVQESALKIEAFA